MLITEKNLKGISKLVIETMGGWINTDAENADKIIKNIAKEVTIDSKA